MEIHGSTVSDLRSVEADFTDLSISGWSETPHSNHDTAHYLLERTNSRAAEFSILLK